VSFLRRIVGVVTSPRQTYSEVVARPKWIDVLALVAAILVAASTAFLATDVGLQALLDSQIQTLELFGRQPTAVELKQFERIGRHAVGYGAAGQIIGLMAAVFGVTTVAFLVGRLTRSRATFKQILAVSSHSSVILGLRALCTTPLNFLRESMSSPTNLGLLVPIFEDGTFGARVFASLDLFSVWWLISLSIGLGVALGWRSVRVAWGLLGAYVAIALLLAGISAALSGV
jgi:hypothetical protein